MQYSRKGNSFKEYSVSYYRQRLGYGETVQRLHNQSFFYIDLVIFSSVLLDTIQGPIVHCSLLYLSSYV